MTKKLKIVNQSILIILFSLFLTNNYSRSLSLVLVLVGGYNIYKNKTYNWKGIEKYILLYFLVQLISVIFGVNMSHSLKEYYRHLYFLIPLFTVSQIVLSYKEKIKVLDISMGIVTLYYFVYVNLQKYKLIKRLPGGYNRVRGFGTDGTIVKYAFVIGVIALYYWFKILKKKEIKKSYIEILMFLCNIYLIILSGTRGLWVGLLSSLLVMSLIGCEDYIKGLKKIIIALIGIASLNIIIFKKGLAKFFERRVLSIGDIILNREKVIRVKIWKVAYKYFEENKILGHGYKPGIWYIVSKHKFSHPHNDYLQILVGSGILGLISYFYMMFGLLYTGIKNKNESIWLYILGVIIFIMIYGLVETLIQLSIGLNIFIFLLSLL